MGRVRQMEAKNKVRGPEEARRAEPMAGCQICQKKVQEGPEACFRDLEASAAAQTTVYHTVIKKVMFYHTVQRNEILSPFFHCKSCLYDNFKESRIILYCLGQEKKSAEAASARRTRASTSFKKRC